MNSIRGKHIVFRADASLRIGIGHVMRCLTLADSLRFAGANCKFVCRAHDGHLLNVIRERGYQVIALPAVGPAMPVKDSLNEPYQLAHADWLGTSWQTDAAQTKVALNDMESDWLIVDHYALDHRWEAAIRHCCQKLMVIDDLADREHICDVLLDQNLIESMDTRYKGKVPAYCDCLIGPNYALLRPEFSALRSISLTRRQVPLLNRLLVFMGGSDVENETSKVVEALKMSRPVWQYIDVIVGQNFPGIQVLKGSLKSLPYATLHVQTNAMAQLMMSADLAVTASGSVTWEKCSLGLPSLVAMLAANQRPIATAMHAYGAQRTINFTTECTPESYAKCLDEVRFNDLRAMSECASGICDGDGSTRVMRILAAKT